MEHGEITINGLPKGSGTAIGSVLRKAMLAHLKGAAITAVRIEGVCHEFDTVDGVYEDVAEIIHRLRQLDLKLPTNSKKLLSLRSASKCVTASEISHSDISLPSEDEEIEILNSDLEIAHLSPDAKLQMEIEVETGTGFRKAEENRKPDHRLGTIPVPSDFSPVKKVGYSVEIEQDETEKLSFQIATNATISPLASLKKACQTEFALKNVGEQWKELLSEVGKRAWAERSEVVNGQMGMTGFARFHTQLMKPQFSVNGQSKMSNQPIKFGDTAFADDLPDLLAFQFDSYDDLIENVVPTLLEEVFPIKDAVGKNSLELVDYKWQRGKQRNTLECTLILTLRLNKNGERSLGGKACPERSRRISVSQTKREKGRQSIVSDVPLLNLPMMTEKGSFIINGEERVVVSQLHRSPGVYFLENLARIIPYVGSWVEFEIKTCPRTPPRSRVNSAKSTKRRNEIIYARLDRRKPIPVTCFLRFLGWESDDEILDLFENDQLIVNTLSIDESDDLASALIWLGRSLGMEDAEAEDVQKRLELMLFDQTRYDLTPTGRHVMNRKLEMDIPDDHRTLAPADVVAIVKNLLKKPVPDDLNDLANLRVRSVGELLGNQLRLDMYRMARVLKERLSLNNLDELTPNDLFKKDVSNPLIARIIDFFKNNELSQFLQSTNPLDELTHKRRVTKMGAGGVDRESADVEIRSLKPSHFGCIDPVETPEGPNVGLIGTLANFAQIDQYGFLSQKAVDPDNRQQTLGLSASLIPLIEHDDPNRALMGANMSRQAVPLLFSEPPIVQTGMERKAAENARISETAERGGRVIKVSANQIVIEVDDSSVVAQASRLDVYRLTKYRRSNMGTSINQRPIVSVGQNVATGQILAEGHCMNATVSIHQMGCRPKRSDGNACAEERGNGMLALGKNLLVAYMPYEGYNYEDGIVISDRLVKEDIFTSVHIASFRVEIRETKTCAEERGNGIEKLTRNLPFLSENERGNLNEYGIVKVGTFVEPYDVLVGRVRIQDELEDLICEKEFASSDATEEFASSDATEERGIRDLSERVPHYLRGQVIRTEHLSRQNGDELPDGVENVVTVDVAMRREVEQGDKFSNRHGFKGVIAKIIPEEEMPHLSDGTSIDMLLNPLGVPTRRNFGQILETHLGWAANELGTTIISPPFDGPRNEQIVELLKNAGLPENGMTQLIDGRTGRAFDMKTTVGYQYLMKLHHLAADKIHARSIGPYSILTGQPVGSKAAIGGQRFGEMEVWALEAYGAAKTLHEFMSLKSNADNSLNFYQEIAKKQSFSEKMVFCQTKRAFALLQIYLRGMALVLMIEEDGAKIKIATPEEIRSWSECEVNEINTLDEMPDDRYGHIELAVPVEIEFSHSESYQLEVLPVIPGLACPEIALDAECTAASDLRELYRQVIEKNSNLRRLNVTASIYQRGRGVQLPKQSDGFESGAEGEILDNAKRALQSAVDALFDNGNCAHPILDASGEPLRSLADMIRGKGGLFRSSLLGSRVDYSGRSVIIPGPELKFDECGLPQDIAFKLFEPFVIQKLKQIANTKQSFYGALRSIRKRRPEALAALSEAMKDRLVLLNRAPTLHRASIQAFKPVLIEGKAISLHPLVCQGFDADFDGDQMAVHLPLLPEVQDEVRERILSHRNVLSPADGRLLAQPKQDIVLGCYYLTNQNYDLRTTLNAQRNTPNGEVIETTAGRVIFNKILDGKLPFVNEMIDRKRLFELIEEIYEKHGESFAVNFLERVKELGFKYATRSGISISLQSLQACAEERRGNGINDLSCTFASEDANSSASEDANSSLPKNHVPRNEVSVAFAGSVPTSSPLLDGVSAERYFRLSCERRLGLIETMMRINKAGYMARKLTNALCDLIVTEEDCGADESRSVVNCQAVSGVCAKCYGNDLSTGRPVKLGTPVGMIAASSISRPVLQFSESDKKSSLPRLMSLLEAKDNVGQTVSLSNIGPNVILSVEDIGKYLLKALQEIYQKNDIEIHPKHFEILIRQMVSKDEVRGIRELALSGDSFLAAASFGNTIQILVKAAIEEQTDPLRGMRESLIVGKLIEFSHKPRTL